MSRQYILFAEDWARFPTARPHFKTRNRSALQFASKLKQLGVTNHLFFLALIDQDLQDVDPYSETLTERQKIKIMDECRINPWYYFRECSRLPMKGSAELKEYRFNRQVVGVLWCFLNHIDVTCIQIRQTGKSLFLRNLDCWLTNCAMQNTLINHVSKDAKLCAEYLSDTKDQMRAMPEAIRALRKTDAANSEQIVVGLTNCKLLGQVPQPSEAGAWKLGRGFTTPIVKWDEGPFSANFHISMPVITASMGAASKDAEMAGVPYGMILTTTAGSLKTDEGLFFYNEYVKRVARWTEKYYDCKNNQELVERVRANCSGEGLITHILLEFNHRQLGLTDEELFEMVSRARTKGVAANMDYFNIWDVTGTDLSVFDEETALRIAKGKKEPEEVQALSNYHLYWHLPSQRIDSYMATNKVIIGLDASEAIGKDNICVYGLDAKTGKCIFTLMVNLSNILTFGKVLANFMIKYSNTIIIPENRSAGATIIDILIEHFVAEGINPFQRIFNWYVNDYDTLKDDLKASIRKSRSEFNCAFYDRYREKFGYKTAGSGRQAREILYGEVFNYAIEHLIDTIQDPILIDQLMGLRKKNNRIDHSSTGHDDMVVAWLLTVFMLTKTKNLKFYGLDPYSILVPTDVKSVAKAAENNHRNMIKSYLASLITEAKKENNPYIKERFIRQIESTKEELSHYGETVNGIDGIIASLRKK